MNATFSIEFLFQQSIDHAMPRWLHLGLECLRDNIESKMGFPRCAAYHGLVVSVEVGVIPDLEDAWVQ